MQAIQEDTDPETNARDNLGTLRVVEAAYLSAGENRSILFDEVQAVPISEQ